MRIISKFKDYYDNISAQYLDKEILYIRKTQWHIFTRNESLQLGHLHLFDYELDLAGQKMIVVQEFIGFCGQLFPVISIKSKGTRETIKASFFNFEQLAQFYLENKLDVEPTNLKIDFRNWRWNSHKARLSDCDRFFKRQERNLRMLDLFEKYQAPVFIIRHRLRSDLEIELNPSLQAYNFQKVKDPFSAHQEIYQFIASRLHQPENQMVQISDKDKIHKHGFDKFSFRKLPGNKRGRGSKI